MAKSSKRGRKVAENVSLDREEQGEFESKMKEKKEQGIMSPGVVYVGHLPWGFFEPQLREFFSQFGTIKRLRLSRSKKTGGSKGFAFIEFACDDVAKVVADTMNNYLMFGKLLKCRYVTKVHPETFKGADKFFRKPRNSDWAIEKHNQPRSSEQHCKAIKRRLCAYKKKMKKLADLGIDYKFDDMIKLSTQKQSVSSEKPVENRTPKSSKKIPSRIQTPKGTMEVLVEDQSDREITFKTPPFTIKSSRIADIVKIEDDSPVKKRKTETSSKSKQKDRSSGKKKSKKSEPDIKPKLKSPVENTGVSTRKDKGLKTLKTSKQSKTGMTKTVKTKSKRKR